MYFPLIIITTLSLFVGKGSSLWCYQCSSAIPGCTTPFGWKGFGYLGTPCPEVDDICIKLIERKDAQELITRDCLSSFKAIRTDIPADTYEGCRPAAPDVQLANYVNNSIKEYDVKRNYYDETTWCFCYLDHRCNSASVSTLSAFLVIMAAVQILNYF